MPDIVIPASFESVIQLGKPVSLYTQSTVSKLINVILCIVCLLFSLWIIYYGGVTYPQEFPKVAASNTPFIVGFGGLILLGTLYWAWKIFSSWNTAAVVYDNGFAHFNGKILQTFKWDEIAALNMRVIKMTYYGFIPVGTQRKYLITGGTGTQFKMDGSLSKVDNLISQIREGIFPHIMARYDETLNKGQFVQFGPISVSKTEGIKSGNKNYSWAEISQIAIVDGTVQVTPKKRGLFSGFSIPVESIPNLDAFLAIASEMAKQNMQAQ